MPIYEYACQRCKHQFEKLVFKGDEDQVACPKCGKEQVKRLISASCFVSSKGFGACTPGTTGTFS